MQLPAPSKAHPLQPPLNVDSIKNEKGVKALIKRLLEYHQWYSWMPAANGYGQQGVADHLAIKNGVFVAIEAKFGYNKPKPMQKLFAGEIIAHDGFAFCVNEQNIDHLAWWLESFEIATQAQSRGDEVPEEHGSRMLNSMHAMMEMFGE